MVISMEPMLTIPESQPGAGGYREHDILVITEDGKENIPGFPYGPAHNQLNDIYRGSGVDRLRLGRLYQGAITERDLVTKL